MSFNGLKPCPRCAPSSSGIRETFTWSMMVQHLCNHHLLHGDAAQAEARKIFEGVVEPPIMEQPTERRIVTTKGAGHGKGSEQVREVR